MDEAEYFDHTRSGAADEESFLEEFRCVPSDDSSAFLTYELIDGCKYPAGEAWETDLGDAKNELFVGVDVGRRKDLTVVTVLERVGGVLFTRLLIEMEKTRFSEQEARIYEVLELPQVRRACFDETGLGMQLAERAQDRFGKGKVEGVTFTGSVKEELAYPVKAAFEDRSIRIPDLAALTSDLRGIRKDTTAAGNVRFAGERTAEGHCDRFWSLALAIHAAKPAKANYAGVLV